jgi:tetratricopeptide (TPR) repeat protein/TolB-like protein
MLLGTLVLAAAAGSVLVAHPDGPAAPEQAWLAETVADQLPRSLSAAGVHAVAREDRLAAQDELGLGTRSVTRATSIRVAEALGVTRLVVGRVEVLEGRVEVSLSLVDVTRGTLSAPLLGRGPAESILQIVHGLAWDVALTSSTPPRVSRALFDAARPAIPISVWKPYAQALASSEAASRRRLLRQALAARPAFDEALLALGREELLAREDGPALATLGRVSVGGPCGRPARFLRGVALLNLGRYREAGELYAGLVAEETTPATLNNEAIARLRQKGSLAAAMALLRRAVDLEPGASDLPFNLGWALLHAGSAEEALFWLQGVVKRDATDTQARVVLSWALRAAGRAAEADAEWAAASAGRSAYAGLLAIDLGRRFERLRLTEGLPALEGEGRSDAELAATHLTRADGLIAAGELEAALSELLRATYLDPWNPRPQVLLARIHRRKSEVALAISAYRMALWARNDVETRLELARYLVEVGRVGEAQQEARRILESDPANEGARGLVESAR